MSQRLIRVLGLRTNPTIFLVSAGMTILFVVAAIAFTDRVDTLFAGLSGAINANIGWLYILGVTSFLVFLFWLALSRYGNVRLGGPEARPQYSNAAWFGMLFAAGIGTILMFWGVAEPISHFANPPLGNVEPETAQAANQAMAFSLYHFGLHTWAIFCLPALAFAYFAYRRKLPFRVSSLFHPLLGERIHGPIGRAIDITAVLGTLFGVAVSIGLGTLQINSGLATLFGVPEGRIAQVMIIAVVTTIATISVALGLDRGIKRLSNLNIGLAVALLLFVLVTGSTVYLLRGVIETTGTYLSSLVPLAFWNDTFADPSWGWQGDWTVFYWAWTITWAPFVGIFIARISKGRRIREFVFGVLGLPTAFTIVWFSVFGLSSFDIEMNRGGGLVDEVVGQGDIPGALFRFLEEFPAATFMSALSVLIVVIFFTTSSDSASLVIDMLCSGEHENPPARQRVFWAVTEGVVAATLIAATGRAALDALQQVITVLGLPFFVIAFFTMYCLVKALRQDVSSEELYPTDGQVDGAAPAPRGAPVRAAPRPADQRTADDRDAPGP
jgi:choline/glycine/proline betaine transport protein